MCLAIFKPPGVDVPSEHLIAGWVRNPDGGGFAHMRKGEIHVEKGFLKWKEFLAAYEAASKRYKDSPFLIHFRIRSMGGKEAENTHPFSFEHGVAIHNGTLSGTGAGSYSGKSDTELFLQKFGGRLTYNRVSANKAGLEEAVGYNKLVLLYDNGKHIIINEKQGDWTGGVWYSNKYSIASCNVTPRN